jgi:hypothetical protein
MNKGIQNIIFLKKISLTIHLDLFLFLFLFFCKSNFKVSNSTQLGQSFNIKFKEKQSF